MMRIVSGFLIPLIGILLALVAADIACAQDLPSAGSGGTSLTGEVEIVVISADPGIPQTQVGIGRVVRPRYWTPMRVVLTNKLRDAPKTVVVEWLLNDADGDEVSSKREVTLTPGSLRPQVVWLYAAVPAAADSSNISWRIRVIDKESGALLAVAPNIRPAQDYLLSSTVSSRLIGLLGRPGMNLNVYQDDVVHQEPTRFQPLAPEDLPDRWYGYAAMDSLIWTPAGPDPNDPQMTPGTYRALEAWVDRGGHLVVMLPSAGKRWFDSPLGDILPRVQVDEQLPANRPIWLGGLSIVKVPTLTFTPNENVTTLLRDNSDRPIVVASRKGLGRITLIGIDLTDRQIVRAGLPNGTSQPWEAIFGWQGPPLSRAQIDNIMNDDDPNTTIRPPMGEFGRRELGRFVAAETGMTATAAGVLFIAIFIFALYWLVAGPLSFYVLRSFGNERHSWVVFAGFVLVFAMFTWAGAALFRPAKTRVQHFTVIDIDAASRTTHAHSWFSLFVPTHGLINLEIKQEDPQASTHDTIAAAGLRQSSVADEFINKQRYSFDAAAPYSIDIPMRSTAKQLELDSVSSLSHLELEVDDGWGSLRGQIGVEGRREGSDLGGTSLGRLVGSLSHDLPGELDFVKLIHTGVFENDGKFRRTTVYNIDGWPSGKTISLPLPPNTSRTFLVPRFTSDGPKGKEYGTGSLGLIMQGRKSGNIEDEMWMYSEEEIEQISMSDFDITNSVMLLSFFDYLSPPLFGEPSITGASVVHYNRAIGRESNLSHLLPTNSVIVIGFMKNSSMPVPLRVDGDEIPSNGWTVVRWVLPLQEVSNSSTSVR